MECCGQGFALHLVRPQPAQGRAPRKGQCGEGFADSPRTWSVRPSASAPFLEMNHLGENLLDVVGLLLLISSRCTECSVALSQ